jgi:acetyltransferase-like isoleucine patch superfamily enzyme/acyl carrier protein
MIGERRARWLLRGCNSVGARPQLDGAVHVENHGYLELGNDVSIRSSPVVSHLFTGPSGVLRIGNDVTIGHGAAISAFTEVVLDYAAVIGPFALILDNDFHQAANHRQPGLRQPIHVGRGAHLGARVTLLRGASIGEEAQVRAGSVVSGQVPAGAVVAGVPAVRVDGAETPPAPYASNVADIVRVAPGLPEPLDPACRRDSLAEWDSLGALNVLLALEQRFHTTLDPSQMLRAETMGDVAALVERSLDQLPHA